MVSGDCNVCINGKMPSYSATCVECGLSRKNYKPMTNADRIRAMSDEELAAMKKICRVTAENLDECEKWRFPDGSPDCYSCALDWLRQEATE